MSDPAAQGQAVFEELAAFGRGENDVFMQAFLPEKGIFDFKEFELAFEIGVGDFGQEGEQAVGVRHGGGSFRERDVSMKARILACKANCSLTVVLFRKGRKMQMDLFALEICIHKFPRIENFDTLITRNLK